MQLQQTEMYQWLKLIGSVDKPKNESKIWGSALHVADVIAALRAASHMVDNKHPGAKGKFFVDQGRNTTEPVHQGSGKTPRMVVNDNIADDPTDPTGVWFYPMGPPPGYSVHDYDTEVLEEGTIW